jgi:hypothetical protein
LHVLEAQCAAVTRGALVADAWRPADAGSTGLRALILALKAAGIVGTLRLGASARICLPTWITFSLRIAFSARTTFSPRVDARIALAQQAGVGRRGPFDLLGHAASGRLTFKLTLDGGCIVAALRPVLPSTARSRLLALLLGAAVLRRLDLTRLLCKPAAGLDSPWLRLATRGSLLRTLDRRLLHALTAIGGLSLWWLPPCGWRLAAPFALRAPAILLRASTLLLLFCLFFLAVLGLQLRQLQAAVASARV